MTVFAGPPAPALTFLNDLTPDSGLPLRRWTPDEFRRLFLSEILSVTHLDLVDGEIVDYDSRLLHGAADAASCRTWFRA